MANVWPGSIMTDVRTRCSFRPGTTDAADGEPVGGVERADDRLDFQVDLAVPVDDRQERQLGAERLEPGADDAAAEAAAGHLRHGLLAAGEERGRPAGGRHQPRLGQQLGQPLLLQGLDEHVQPGRDDAGDDVGGRARGEGTEDRLRAEERAPPPPPLPPPPPVEVPAWARLPIRLPPNAVVPATAKLTPKLRSFGAVHLGDDHVELHLADAADGHAR